MWLFDVKADPEERKDLSTVYPQIVKLLLSRLAQYNATAVPALYPPPDPRAAPELHGGVWRPWA